MRLALACNSITPEVERLAQALPVDEVAALEVGLDLATKVHELKPSFVVNCFTGLKSVHSVSLVPLVLEELGIPYSGSDSVSLALCADVCSWKSVIHQLPTSKFIAIETQKDVEQLPKTLKALRLPYIVKMPQGSVVSEDNIIDDPSDLISLCAELFEAGAQKVLIEEYIAGRELIVVFYDDFFLGICELRLALLQSRIFGIEARARAEKLEPKNYVDAPAFLQPDAMRKHVAKVAHDAAVILGLQGLYFVKLRLVNNRMPTIIDLGQISPSQLCSGWFTRFAESIGKKDGPELLSSYVAKTIADYGPLN